MPRIPKTTFTRAKTSYLHVRKRVKMLEQCTHSKELAEKVGERGEGEGSGDRDKGLFDREFRRRLKTGNRSLNLGLDVANDTDHHIDGDVCGCAVDWRI